MANKRIEMINLKHLIRLKIKNKSNRDIAKSLGIARRTVNAYVRFLNQLERSYEELYELEESELFELFPKRTNKLVAKYEVLSDKFAYYEKELKRPGGTYLNLWEEYKQAHPEGYSYSQFKNHIKDWIKRQKVSMRVEHKYGDKLFVDYTGKKLKVVDRDSGMSREVEVFVAILGGSQYTYVEATETQQLDDFLGSVGNALAYIGGVTQAIVPDNLKSAVTLPDWYEPDVNRNFRAFGLHYDTTILPTRPGKPKDKSLVEGMVKLVYQHVFFPLRNQVFFSLKDLNRAIWQQLEKFNSKAFSGRDYSRKDLFEQEEKQLLGPLAKERFVRKIYREYQVNTDTHVWFGEDKHYYSVPHCYIGKHVQIQATKTTLEVYYNYQRIALHQRSDKIGGFTTIAEHLPPNIRFVKDWSMDQFTGKAQKIGLPTYQYFCKIYEYKKHPEQAHKSCMGILALAGIFPSNRINAACQRADFYSNYSFRTIKNILEKGIDLIPMEPGTPMGDHRIMTEADPNIRGPEYYH